MAMAQHKSVLPFDIIEAVLSKVSSVKSLLRFKTVCKSWNKIISNPVFVRTYLHRFKYSNSHNLFISKMSYNSNSERYLVKLEDRKLQIVQLLKSPRGFKRVFCYCEGVLLLTRDLKPPSEEFVLWNPSTQTQTVFQLMPYSFDDVNVNDPKSYGLCYNETVGEFKVVVVCRGYYAVFSCKNKSWSSRRKCFEDDIDRMIYGSSGVVSVDGAVYWVMWDVTNGDQIVYFDPRDDNFKILQKPEYVEYYERSIFSVSIFLVDLRGCLCLYCNGRDETMVEIWMKEKGLDNNSWKKLMTIKNVDTEISSFEPLCFVENKILILLDAVCVSSRFTVYSPCEKTFEQVDEASDVLSFFGLVPYVETLFFSDENEKAQEEQFEDSEVKP